MAASSDDRIIIFSQIQTQSLRYLICLSIYNHLLPNLSQHFRFEELWPPRLHLHQIFRRRSRRVFFLSQRDYFLKSLTTSYIFADL